MCCLLLCSFDCLFMYVCNVISNPNINNRNKVNVKCLSNYLMSGLVLSLVGFLGVNVL